MNEKNHFSPARKYKLLVSAVHSIYRLINSTFELRDLIIRLSRLVSQIFNVRYCQIIILDPSKKYAQLKCLSSGRKKSIICRKIKILSRMEKGIIKTSSSVRRDKLLALPMICEDIMGIILIKRTANDAPFDKLDQEILTTIAEQATIGIKNLQLYEEQQKIVLGSIKSLVTLLDMRIPQEYTHSPYFSNLVTAIGQKMHLEHKQIESLKYASLLHDAGKIDVPIEILTKKAKLTPSEYRIIKRHPIKGAEILRPLQVLKPAIPIIMHHHEKYNGSGYPSGLKKKQIPQGARIMAVADAFEAMVYGRPYRERMDIGSAIKEIKKKSATQFDPRVVEAFLKVVKNKYKKYLQLAEQTRYNNMHNTVAKRDK